MRRSSDGADEFVTDALSGRAIGDELNLPNILAPAGGVAPGFRSPVNVGRDCDGSMTEFRSLRATVDEGGGRQGVMDDALGGHLDKPVSVAIELRGLPHCSVLDAMTCAAQIGEAGDWVRGRTTRPGRPVAHREQCAGLITGLPITVQKIGVTALGAR